MIPEPCSIRRLQPGDAEALMRFYNGLSETSKRSFRPIGVRADLNTCLSICQENTSEDGDRYDLVAEAGDDIIGWGFICGLHGERPSLGLAIADAHRRRGFGKAMMAAIMHWARHERQLAAVHLIVLQENTAARRLYESFGFHVAGTQIDEADELGYFQMTAELSAADDR